MNGRVIPMAFSCLILTSPQAFADMMGAAETVGNFVAGRSLDTLPVSPLPSLGGVAAGAIPGAINRMNSGASSFGEAYVDQLGKIAAQKAGQKSLGLKGSGTLSKFALGAAGSYAAGEVYDAMNVQPPGGSGALGGIQGATPNNNGLGQKSGITQYILSPEHKENSSVNVGQAARNNVPPTVTEEIIKPDEKTESSETLNNNKMLWRTVSGVTRQLGSEEPIEGLSNECMNMGVTNAYQMVASSREPEKPEDGQCFSSKMVNDSREYVAISQQCVFPMWGKTEMISSTRAIDEKTVNSGTTYIIPGGQKIEAIMVMERCD